MAHPFKPEVKFNHFTSPLPDNMGQGLSCRGNNDHGLFTAVQQGNLQIVTTLLQQDPSLFHQKTLFDRFSPLHIAAANGQIEVNSFSLFSAKFSLRFCFVLFVTFLFCFRFCLGFYMDLLIQMF